MTASGKSLSLDAWLVGDDADPCTRECEAEADRSLAGMPLRSTYRDVVEVDCKIAEVEPGDTHGVKHDLLHVELIDVIASDPEVDGDVREHLASHAYVLVAIRYGDPHRGFPEPIPGLVQGADLRVRGRWVPAAQAYPTGGEKLSVLHFTHSPVGFIMVGGTVYR
jgi:endonuclease G